MGELCMGEWFSLLNWNEITLKIKASLRLGWRISNSFKVMKFIYAIFAHRCYFYLSLDWVGLPYSSECSVHICCHNQPALSESKHSSLAKWGFKCLKTNVATHQLYYSWWCSSLAWQTTPGSHCRGKNLVERMEVVVALLLVVISELQKFLRLFISVQIFVTRLSWYTQRWCCAHSSSATSLWLLTSWCPPHPSCINFDPAPCPSGVENEKLKNEENTIL